ncbi:DUF2304 domain-containing protein [Ruminococcus sp. 5_1_39BFAA]|uniref:DUF2304 domain-containing protein n=1 Tax=Ruminococcus sp. 5_1_39BFAA TaxID=457412 RepID=UPI0035641041
MISLVFRIALIVCSLLTSIFMIKKIRNSKLQIEHAIFWLLFAFLLIIISIFPQLTIWGAKLLGIYSSTNFIFLVILFIVILKLFSATIEISNLEYRIKELSQKMAIEEKVESDKRRENKKEDRE